MGGWGLQASFQAMLLHAHRGGEVVNSMHTSITLFTTPNTASVRPTSAGTYSLGNCYYVLSLSSYGGASRQRGMIRTWEARLGVPA